MLSPHDACGGMARRLMFRRRGSRRPWGRMLKIGQVSAKDFAHLRRRLEPPVRILLQEAIDHRDQPLRDLRIHRRDRPRRVLRHPLDHRRQTIAAKWRTAGTHGVQHGAQAEQIATLVHVFAASLLR